MKVIARGSGRSAVAAIAYRSATKMLNERDGLLHDFTGKQGVEHAEIVLPDGVKADWALDRSGLWNAVERAEKRKDARVAREFEIALPHELSAEQRYQLTGAFAQDLANRYGAAVDFAIHRPSEDGDVRNHHAHVVMTTRQVTPEGLGEKTLIERENKWLLNAGQPTSHMQLRDIRQAWEEHANRSLMRAGLDVRIDHKSHLERGLTIEPTEHMGVHAAQMDRRGLSVSRQRLEADAAKRNAGRIRKNPGEVLSILTDEKSVFDRHDVARALHRYIDDSQAFLNAFASVMASSSLVELQPEQNGELARYTTREMLTLEHQMAGGAVRLGEDRSHHVRPDHVASALDRQDAAIRTAVASSLGNAVARGEISPSDRDRKVARAGLSEEQRLAVRHITGPERIAAVIGFAGAGKSTMLAAAREAWARQGIRVVGAALAGKAAEGLEESSSIVSRTLASWEYGWQTGKGLLDKGDVFVIDEAGMVGSRQLARFVAEVEARGAKLVLVGDHEQLQAIGAGSPFRAIVERTGAVELSEIRRQKQDWQRQASIAFATHRTADALQTYADRGAIEFAENGDAARAALVRDYLADLETHSRSSRIALAHRRADVRAINADIRSALQVSGQLPGKQESEQRYKQHDEQRQERLNKQPYAAALPQEIVYDTHDGKRAFASGDRIVLLENNRDLGVKNGMLGTVEAVKPDAIQVRLDGAGQYARNVFIPVKSYQAFDHGYATTIHKSQGATVDRAFVMASATMDRHLTYVAMTRHREGVRLYVDGQALKDVATLGLSMGRSGVKETTLDYTTTYAERRGLAEAFGIGSEIDVGLTRAGDVRAEQHGERPETSGNRVEKVAPLVPAVTRHDRSVDDVAREKARPQFEQAMESVRSTARLVYAEPEAVAKRITAEIVEGRIDSKQLASGIADRPAAFGVRLGKTGILGDNRERKAAQKFAKALGNHVRRAAETWQRRLTAERESETWNREKRDVVEVPGLSPQSERILSQLDSLPYPDKPAFIAQISQSPEGRQALSEAATIVSALERRFGTADLQRKDVAIERLGPELATRLDRVRSVAKIVERAHRAELTQQQELKRSLTKGLGLRM